jgi:hypothetical protein
MSFFVQEKDHYKKNAKPECRECKGQGIIDYHVDQDWIEQGPCIKCFPDDEGAQRITEWWASRSHFRPKIIDQPSSR